MGEPVLVTIFLRGGCDSLSMIAPAGDAEYIAARSENLRVLRKGDAAGRVLRDPIADADFRFHPQAAALADLYDAGDLSVVHAAGLTLATRSHFDAEARIEAAANGSEGGGWLGRWLAAAKPGGALPALAVGSAMPGSLAGSGAAVASELQDLMAAAGHWLAPAIKARLAEGFGTHPLLGTTVAQLVSLSDAVGARVWNTETNEARAYAPDVEYPQNSPLSRPLMTVARAIKSDLGLRIATVDYGGWDTHVNQAGQFGDLTAGLSTALMAFWRDLGARQQDVSVVVMSEFGRRLRANASGGTDHGRAGAMMVLGPQAKGGRMLGRWPGLKNEALEEGADLAVTTDYRSVLAEVISGHMGMQDLSAVFPGFTPEPVGVWG
jgi:uncharacterized protein (DUF1501 family)